MIPWETVAEGGPGESLKLLRRGDEWSIHTRGFELMNSKRIGSEEALATLAASAMNAASAKRVLVGGLGMGYTLRAALTAFPNAEVVVAEISPSVVAWNREHLGHLADHPLRDPRCRVFAGDVAEAIAQGATQPYDAILLDVDNGPEAVSHDENATLYGHRGLAAARAALTKGGICGIWAAGPHAPFEKRARKAGFRVDTHRVAQWKGSGRRHVVWLLS